MNIIKILISAVLVNNLILSNYIGINPVIVSSKSEKSSLTFGVLMTIMLTLSTCITKLLNDYVLVKYSLEHFRIFTFVLVIIFINILSKLLIKNNFKMNYKKIESFTPLLIINNLFLGVALLVVKNNLSLLDTVVYSIGVSLGFMLISILVSSINYKYRYPEMPKAFRGLPITIMALGLIALAFYGFQGLV